jgi:hypothetical protein
LAEQSGEPYPSRHPERSGRPRSGRPRSRRTPYRLDLLQRLREFLPRTEQCECLHASISVHAHTGSFDFTTASHSRSSSFAQDDIACLVILSEVVVRKAGDHAVEGPHAGWNLPQPFREFLPLTEQCECPHASISAHAFDFTTASRWRAGKSRGERGISTEHTIKRRTLPRKSSYTAHEPRIGRAYPAGLRKNPQIG